MKVSILKSRSLRIAPLLFFGMVSIFAGSADQLLEGRFDSSSRKIRHEIALDVKQRVVDLLNYVPALKPNEVAWVINEKAEIQKIQDTNARSEREEKLVSSPEFQQMRLRSDLQEIVNSLDKAMSPKISIRAEILNWCIASHNPTNNEEMNDAIKILIQSGRLPSDLAQKVRLGEAIGYTGLLGWWGRGIQEHLVIPYLKGGIKK